MQRWWANNVHYRIGHRIMDRRDGRVSNCGADDAGMGGGRVAMRGAGALVPAVLGGGEQGRMLDGLSIEGGGGMKRFEGVCIRCGCEDLIENEINLEFDCVFVRLECENCGQEMYIAFDNGKVVGEEFS